MVGGHAAFEKRANKASRDAQKCHASGFDSRSHRFGREKVQQTARRDGRHGKAGQDGATLQWEEMLR